LAVIADRGGPLDVREALGARGCIPARSPAGRGAALVAAASLALAGLALGPAQGARAGQLAATTSLVSADPSGGEETGSNAGYPPALSRDGRHVAFASAASTLVRGDTGGRTDVFVRDLDPATGAWTTTRVSVGLGGAEADGDSTEPSISADGRYVAFTSQAANLVKGDANGTSDVFLWDRKGGGIVRVSGNSLGGDAGGWSWQPSVSADGQVVSFLSDAPDLVPGDGNGFADVFVWDTRAGPPRVTLVSGAPSGAPTDGDAWQQALSADGGTVVFTSDATNLVADDGNQASDVFVHDRASGRTTLESRGSDGAVGDNWSYYPAISGDGGVVAFDSLSSNLAPNDGERPDIFVRDRTTGQTTIASVSASGGKADAASFAPSLSADGRYLAFDSDASNLVVSDANGNGSDVFVRDLAAGRTTLVSVDATGLAPFDQAYNAAISGDGTQVAFVGLTVLPGLVDAQYYLRGPLLQPPLVGVASATPTTVPPVASTTPTTTTATPTTTTSSPTTTSGPATTIAPTTTQPPG
jgi:Tol biopolymer transport system component